MHLNMIGGAYTGKSRDANLQECINWYFEPDRTGGEPALMPRPGLQAAWFVDPGEIRMLYHYKLAFESIGDIVLVLNGTEDYVRVLNKTFNALSNYTSVRVKDNTGKIVGSRPVIAKDNGTHVMFVDGSNGWIFDPTLYNKQSGNCLVKLTEAQNFFGGNWCTMMDGFFIYGPANSNMGYYSSPYGYTFDPTHNFTAEGSSGFIVRGFAFNNELWIFKDETYQIFLNSGQADGIFTPVNRPGTEGDIGCLAKDSVATIDNTIFWLANDFTFRKATGYNSTVISTPQISSKLMEYANPELAIAYAFSRGGKSFYICSFPGGKTGGIPEGETWMFETSTGLWTRMASFIREGNMTQGRYRGNCVTQFGKKTYVGDYSNGRVYELADNVYTDHGQPMVWDRIATTLRNKRDDRGYTINKFNAKVETGLITPTNITGTDIKSSPPMFQVRYTDDGYNWSEWETEHLGITGEYARKIEFLNHGWVEPMLNRTYHVRVTSLGKVSLFGADIKVEPDARG